MVFCKSCLTLVLLAILLTADVEGQRKRHQSIGDYNPKLYYGTRDQAIATIGFYRRYKEWKRQPWKCQGFFVDVKKVVTACSCVAYSTFESHESTPWYHETDPSWGLQKVLPSDIYVGRIRDEFVQYANNLPVNKVDVEKIELARDCATNYRSNMAIVTMKKELPGSKLAWVYVADWLVMRWATQKVAMGSATATGRCEVMRWSNHSKPLQEGSRSEKEKPRSRFSEQAVRFDAEGNQRVLQANAINLLPWHDCLQQVCPEYAPDDLKIKKRLQERRECFNEYNVTRFCVSWRQMDSLCTLPEGTPVFCDVGDIHGVFGILTNHTIWCAKTFNYYNVMIGVDTIMNALYHVLRIRNGPGYDDGWPEYLDVQRTPDDYKLQ